MQASRPPTGLWVPTMHAVHAPPSSPVYPALHLQSVTLLLAASEKECAGHGMQSDALSLPSESTNVPASQGAHRQPTPPHSACVLSCRTPRMPCTPAPQCPKPVSLTGTKPLYASVCSTLRLTCRAGMTEGSPCLVRVVPCQPRCGIVNKFSHDPSCSSFTLPCHTPRMPARNTTSLGECPLSSPVKYFLLTCRAGTAKKSCLAREISCQAVRALGGPHRVLVLASKACRARAPVISRVSGVAFTIGHVVAPGCRRRIRRRAV